MDPVWGGLAQDEFACRSLWLIAVPQTGSEDQGSSARGRWCCPLRWRRVRQRQSLTGWRTTLMRKD